MTLNDNGSVQKKCADMAKKAYAWLSMPQQLLRKYYSTVLETEVSQAQARAMTEAQAAFFMTVLPADYPVIIRMAACAWFVVALLRLREKW